MGSQRDRLQSRGWKRKRVANSIAFDFNAFAGIAMPKILSLVSKWHDFVISELVRHRVSDVNAWILVIRDRTVNCRMHGEPWTH